MQTVGIITTSATCPSDYQRGSTTTEHPAGCRTKKEDYGTHQCRNAFLKTSIHPIAPKEIIREWNDVDHNYLTHENYEYLRKSAMQYARLLNVEFIHKPGKTIGEGVANLYSELETIIGDNLNLTFETIEDKLVFVIWCEHRWNDHRFYWIPVKFIRSLHGKFRRIAITFLHDFARSNGTSTLCACDDTDMIIEYLRDSVTDYDFDKKELRKNRDLLDSYQAGPIYRLLQQVDQKCYYKKLPEAINRYKPQNEFEKKLIKLFREGLQFIGNSTPSIMHYSYDPLNDVELDCSPVRLDRMFRLHYDSDWFSESMQEEISSEIQMGYSISPVTMLELSPESTAVFTMDDYPERLEQWIENFVTFLYNN